MISSQMELVNQVMERKIAFQKGSTNYTLSSNM